MVRKAVSGLGRTLVTAGVILLLFVAYQLWGTGINTARAQSSLGKELSGGFDAVPKDLLGASPISSTVVAPTTTSTASTASTTASTTTATSAEPTAVSTIAPDVAPSTVADGGATTAPRANPTPSLVPPTTAFGTELVSRKTSKQLPLRSGEAVGQLVIPRISVDKAIVQGTSVEALKKGPGHYKTTPFPGEEGNAAIACHRTTYGGPCFRLNELKPGDPIFVARKDAKGNAQWFRYNVYDTLIVKPSNNEVLLPQDGRNTLTLTTCHPQYSAKQRLVVHAELVGPAVESELIDAAKDPLSEEYQRQLDAKTRPAAPTSASTPSTTTAGGPSETTFEDPVITEVPTTSVAETTLPSTGATPPSSDPTGSAAQSDQPRFDGERSTRTLYRLGFFTGTAPAWLHTLGWAAVCAAIWLAVWLLAHRRRHAIQRWALYALGFVVLFLPALYFCFENVSRLLPEAV